VVEIRDLPENRGACQAAVDSGAGFEIPSEAHCFPRVVASPREFIAALETCSDLPQESRTESEDERNQSMPLWASSSLFQQRRDVETARYVSTSTQ